MLPGLSFSILCFPQTMTQSVNLSWIYPTSRRNRSPKRPREGNSQCCLRPSGPCCYTGGNRGSGKQVKQLAPSPRPTSGRARMMESPKRVGGQSQPFLPPTQSAKLRGVTPPPRPGETLQPHPLRPQLLGNDCHRWWPRSAPIGAPAAGILAGVTAQSPPSSCSGLQSSVPEAQ